MNPNDVDRRVEEYKRNNDLDCYMSAMNLYLKDGEMKALEEVKKEYPVIFVMGAMRSGSTLMMQWLADTGEFAYPSNMLSRFYGTPIIGSKIQRLLTDSKYNFRNEITDFNMEISYESANGKTRGALEPNEFWYFWRRFLPEDLWNYSDAELLNYVDIETMRKEIWGIAEEFDKPFALKGMICNYNISFLNQIFPKAIFVWIKRDLERNVRSVMEARKRQYGTYNQWYSFRIPEYEELIKIDDIEEQVRLQIHYINRAIEDGFKDVEDAKIIKVNYEEFCRKPSDLYFLIYDKLKIQGYLISNKYNGKMEFKAR